MAFDSKAADAAIATLVSDLASRQGGVKGATGKYRQCFPQDKTSWGSWDGCKPDPAVVLVRVDEYVAPGGPGWQIVATSPDGKQRRVVHGSGPEPSRESGWAALETS